MLYQQRPVAVVLAGVHQELLELMRVPGAGSPPPVFGRHLPHACTEPCRSDGGDLHEVGASTDDVEDFHQFFSLPRITRTLRLSSGQVFTNCLGFRHGLLCRSYLKPSNHGLEGESTLGLPKKTLK